MVVSLNAGSKVIDSAMNDKCASGTGRFLESAAQLVLHIPLEDLGRLASKATNTFKMSSTCTVFAQTEIISLLAAGESKENIIAGLHASIASQVGSMAKRLGFRSVVMTDRWGSQEHRGKGGLRKGTEYGNNGS